MLREHLPVVEFPAIREHMRVGVGRQAQLALADEARNLGPRAALPVA